MLAGKNLSVLTLGLEDVGVKRCNVVQSGESVTMICSQLFNLTLVDALKLDVQLRDTVVI